MTIPPYDEAFVERSSDDVRGQRDQMELQAVDGAIRGCGQQAARYHGRPRRPAPYVFARPQSRSIGTHQWYHTAPAL
jgi:hypothetical protein